MTHPIRPSLPSREKLRGLRPPALGVAFLAVVLLRSPTVHAQPLQQEQPVTDPAGAEVLFNDAKKAMAAGDYESACPKLAESYRLDPGTGTLTALAVCHENLGKTATAWAEFIEVVSEAAQAHRPDRERFAKQHIALLEPKLSKLTVIVDAAAQAIHGLEVRRDGLLVGRPAWGTAVPVDPGEHTVEAVADGKLRWTISSKVREADSQTVTVPALEDVPVPPPAPSVVPPPTSAGDASSGETRPREEPSPSQLPSANPQRAIGLIVGAVGIAAAGVGTFFGVEALSKSSDANGLCPASKCSSAEGLNDESTARGSAWAADVAIGGAIVALGVGTVLLLTAPRRGTSGSAVNVAPLLFSRAAGPRAAGPLYTVWW
jgi:hypothetical protein